MDYCGDCKHINGICLNVGFCDRRFCEVRLDRPACSADFERNRPARREYVTPKTALLPKAKTRHMAEPQPVVAEQPDVEVKPQHTKTKRVCSFSLLSRLTTEERLYLIKAYYDEPIADIQAKFGVSRMCLLRTLKALGVQVRRRGQVTKAGKESQMNGVKKHFAERRGQ